MTSVMNDYKRGSDGKEESVLVPGFSFRAVARSRGACVTVKATCGVYATEQKLLRYIKLPCFQGLGLLWLSGPVLDQLHYVLPSTVSCFTRCWSRQLCKHARHVGLRSNLARRHAAALNNRMLNRYIFTRIILH